MEKFPKKSAKPLACNPPPSTPTAVFSVLTGHHKQRLTKLLFLDENGELIKQGPSNAGSGHVETVAIPLTDLPDYLKNLSTNQCLIHGTVKDGMADDGPVRVVTDATRRKGGGTLSRTLDFFEHPDGHCLSMLDYDPERRTHQPPDPIRFVR